MEEIRQFYRIYPSYVKFYTRLKYIKLTLIIIGWTTFVLTFLKLGIALFLFLVTLPLLVLAYSYDRGIGMDRIYYRYVAKNDKVMKWYHLLEPGFEDKTVHISITGNHTIAYREGYGSFEYLTVSNESYKALAVVALYAKYKPIWDEQERIDLENHIKNKELEVIERTKNEKERREREDEESFLRKLRGE